MKIHISKTELYGLPNVAANRFYCEYAAADSEQLTPIQRTAALCVRYGSAVSQGGHEGFFAEQGDIALDELRQALVDIQATEFAAHLPSAPDDEADAWFDENCELLYDAINVFREENIDEFFEIVDEDYTVYAPPGLVWLGLFEAAFFFILMGIFIITTPEDALLIFLSFGALASIGLVLVAYVKIWRITVRGDIITARTLYGWRKTAHMEDITHLKQRRDGFVIRTDKYRRFAAAEHALYNYHLLTAQLRLAGKFVDEAAQNITVRQPIANRILAVFSPFGAFCVLFPLFEQLLDSPQAEDILILSLVMLACLAAVCFYLTWKLTLEGNRFHLRSLLGSKSFSLTDITAVTLDDKQIRIYLQGSKRPLKLGRTEKSTGLLLERLHREGVEFEQAHKGKRR